MPKLKVGHRGTHQTARYQIIARGTVATAKVLGKLRERRTWDTSNLSFFLAIHDHFDTTRLLLINTQV